jgi:hypothetical protein
MPEANQHLQISVQRLRSKEIATLIPGSRLPAPQALRPERPPGLNMPHPTRPGIAKAAFEPEDLRWDRKPL